MSLLNDVMAHNAHFVAERKSGLVRKPAKRVVIFTCMDTRLVEFLEPAMGLRRGDAQVIKNAGTTVLDPNGGVIRSLAVAIYALDCKEVFVVGHLDCGMADLDVGEIEKNMLSRGVPPETIAALSPSLNDWLGTFHDVEGNITRVAQLLRVNPFMPRDLPVHGMIFDPASGQLTLLD